MTKDKKKSIQIKKKNKISRPGVHSKNKSSKSKSSKNYLKRSRGQ